MEEKTILYVINHQFQIEPPIISNENFKRLLIKFYRVKLPANMTYYAIDKLSVSMSKFILALTLEYSFRD